MPSFCFMIKKDYFKKKKLLCPQVPFKGIQGLQIVKNARCYLLICWKGDNWEIHLVFWTKFCKFLIFHVILA